MNSAQWLWLPVAAISSGAYAATYFTTEQAQQAIFPGKMMTAAFVALSDAQAKQIEKTTGGNVRTRDVKAWKVEGGGVFVLDEEVGKHEFITYAAAIHAHTRICSIHILHDAASYR